MFDTRNAYGSEYKHPLLSRVLATVFLNTILALGFVGGYIVVNPAHNHKTATLQTAWK